MRLSAKALRDGIAVAVLATLVGGLTASAAHADWRDRRGRGEHEHRERAWRERRYDNRYYYGNRVYVAPPIVYGPPPPPPGLNLFFNVR
jgi:hypothetical protein